MYVHPHLPRARLPLVASITSPTAPSFQGACNGYRGQESTLIACLLGRVPLLRPSLRGGARHRWNFLLSSGPTKLVWREVNLQTSRRMLMLRPPPRAAAPPGRDPLVRSTRSARSRLRSSWQWSFFFELMSKLGGSAGAGEAGRVLVKHHESAPSEKTGRTCVLAEKKVISQHW